MRVMCIENEDEDAFDGPAPEVGEICNVVRQCIGIGKSGEWKPCYSLKEYNPGEDCYLRRNFAPLSDISETTIQENKKEYA